MCVGIVSWSGFLSPLASSIVAPSLGLIARELHAKNHTITTLPVSLYVFGLGVGPFLLSPLSETIGRRWVYICSGFIFFLFNMGSALCKNMASLCVLRFLAGAFGSTGPSIGAASIGDMFVPAQRGRAIAMYALGPILGPSIGNIIAAWIVDRTHSWTWPLWVVTIVSATIPLLSLGLQETYAPVLKERKAECEIGVAKPKAEVVRQLRKAIYLASKRPIKMMFTNPVCLVFAMYQAFIYGILYLAFTTFPLIFSADSSHPGLHNYGWSVGIFGLVYVPLAVGSITATFLNFFLANRFYAYAAKVEPRLRKAPVQDLEKTAAAGPPQRRGKPEYRLPFSSMAMFILTVGLFWFGWSTQAGNFWLVPLIGIYLIGVGATLSFQGLQMYLVDAFIPFSASAISVSVLLRSIVGGVFPFFGEQLYISCGYGWGNSILAFATLAALPISVGMILWGEGARTRFQFKD